MSIALRWDAVGEAPASWRSWVSSRSSTSSFGTSRSLRIWNNESSDTLCAYSHTRYEPDRVPIGHRIGALRRDFEYVFR